jgi:hypothetical protein
VILANCIQMLSMLGSIALAPNNPPAAINVFIQTAQLILNVAHTIFKKPIPRAHRIELKRALHTVQQNIYKLKAHTILHEPVNKAYLLSSLHNFRSDATQSIPYHRDLSAR